MQALVSKCGNDFAKCMLKDWDNIDIGMVSDLDIIQLQQKDKDFRFDNEPKSDDENLIKDWKRQQVLTRFKELKSILITQGAGEYVKSIEKNNNLIDVIEQMEQVSQQLDHQKIHNNHMKQKYEESSLEQDVSSILE